MSQDKTREERPADTRGAVDLGQALARLRGRRKLWAKVWAWTFALSALWILPQPRYYTCEVALAPETAGEDMSGLAGIASNFGVSIGGQMSDAIYPTLYPELMESSEFVTGLFGVRVATLDGRADTDYYDYLARHQKKNWLTRPYYKAKRRVKRLFSSAPAPAPGTGKDIDPFRLSEYDYELAEKVRQDVTCSVDKKTSVCTIRVKDQDALVAATMADSVSRHLQDFITRYRTHKARLDVDHYAQLADSARREYEAATARYSAYCDSHRDALLQAYLSERDKLEKDMEMRYATYSALSTQLEATRAKLQERTPAFTTLRCATVPVKPAGPKRMLFVLGMLLLATFVTALWLARDVILGRD